MKAFVFLGILLIGLAVLVWQSTLFGPQTEPRDLGVSASERAWESVQDKVGDAPPGIVAGGILLSSSFTNEEVTSFVAVLAKEHNLPLKDLQVLLHDGFFEASGLVSAKVISGDVYVKGKIVAENPQSISLSIQELESETLPGTENLKEALEQAANQGIQSLLERYAPDERFFRIETIEFQENSLTVEGIFPQEFFPGSSIRF